VNPCVTCTKQGGAEQKMMPIKDEQGAAFFERPFRTQETNAPHGCGLEWHFSSMLLLQGRPRTSRVSQGEPSCQRACGCGPGLSSTFRAFCGSGASLSGHFEPAAALAQAQAAISNHLWLRSKLKRHFSSILRLRGRLEQHFSRILLLRARLEQHFSSILRLRGKFERPFRGSCCSGAGSSGHFEPSAAPGLVLTTVAVFRAPVHNMHEARWSRAKDDADKRRTRGSIFRAPISSARNERTSRLWARAALFEHAAAPGQATNV